MNNRYWQLLGLQPTRDCAFINAAFLEQISRLDHTGRGQAFRRLQDAREYALLYAADQAPLLDEAYLIQEPDSAEQRAVFCLYDDVADLLLNRPAEQDACAGLFQQAAADPVIGDGARIRLIGWLATLMHRCQAPSTVVTSFDRAFGLRGRLPMEAACSESLRFWYLQAVDVKAFSIDSSFWKHDKWMSLVAVAVTACAVYFLLAMVFDGKVGGNTNYSRQELNQYLQLESTPQLAWAISRGDLDLTLMALEGGADVNGQVPGETMPLLVLAANQGHHTIVSEMLAHGADLERGDQYGFLAIHHAVANNDEEMLALFLRAGADPYRKGAMGFSALDMAHNFRHYHLVQMMDPNAPSSKALLP